MILILEPNKILKKNVNVTKTRYKDSALCLEDLYINNIHVIINKYIVDNKLL